MKKLILLASLLGCQDHAETKVSVKFSPKGGVTQSIVSGIDASEKEVRIQAFSFTSAAIADSLVSAKTNGRHIEVVLDRENLYNKNSMLGVLYSNNITIYIDDKHAIAHNKIIIVDDNVVFTGSANLTRAAEEHNAENSIKIVDRDIAQSYIDNFNKHKEHSYIYIPSPRE